MHVLSKQKLKSTLALNYSITPFSQERYFIPVCCFLLFNVMDWTGRSVTSLVQWVNEIAFYSSIFLPRVLFMFCRISVSLSLSLPQPPKESRLFPTLVVSRVIFVPLLMLCNVQERHLLPVLFSNDWPFIIIMIFFSVSSGYCVCLSMSYAPQ